MPCSLPTKSKSITTRSAIASRFNRTCCPGATAESGRVDYEILVPADASVTLHSSTGPLRAEKLHGDVTLEGAAATVDVRDITNAHVHVKTLNGPVTLTNVQDGHVEVDSLSGTVTLNRVNGPLVQVISTSGGINYIGDFGDSGEYRLTSHSGDIDATVPDSHFRRRERPLRPRRSARRYSSPTQSAHLVRRERGKCLLGYHGSGRGVFDRRAAQLQW